MYSSLTNIRASWPAGGQAISSNSKGIIGFRKESASVTSRWQISDRQYFCVTQQITTCESNTIEKQPVSTKYKGMGELINRRGAN